MDDKKNFSVPISCIVLFLLVFVKAGADTSLCTRNDMYNTIFEMLSYFLYVALFLGNIRTIHITKKKLFIIIGALLLLGVSVVYNHKIFMLSTVIAIMACYKIEYKKIVQAMCYSMLFSMVVIIILNIVGVLPSIEKFRGNDVRLSLGFQHANTVGLYVLSLILFFILMNYDKWKKKYYLLIIIAVVFMHYTCKSRASEICCIISMILIILSKLLSEKVKNNIIIKAIIYSISPVCVLATYIAAKFYNVYKIFPILNKYFSDRLYINSIYFASNKVKLFSTDIVVYNNWYLDSGYSVLLLCFGLIPTIFFIFLNIANLKKAFDQSKYAIIICIIIWSIYGLYETGPLYFWYNATLLFIFAKSEREIDANSLATN